MIRANVRALWSANKQATKCMTFDRNQSSHSIRIFRERQQQQRPQDTRHTRYSHVRVCNQIVLTKFPVNQAPDMSSVCANVARRAKTPLSRAHNVIYVPSSISFPYYVTIEPKMTDKFVNVFGCTLPVCVCRCVSHALNSQLKYHVTYLLTLYRTKLDHHTQWVFVCRTSHPSSSSSSLWWWWNGSKRNYFAKHTINK